MNKVNGADEISTSIRVFESHYKIVRLSINADFISLQLTPLHRLSDVRQ